MHTRQWVLLGAVAATVLTALLFAAPYMAPHGTFVHLDGTPVYVDNGWQGHGIAGAAYMLGDILCHQQMGRSLILNGSQMPVCTRDIGIIAGATAGLFISAILHLRLADRRWAFVGAALISVTGIEWAAEHLLGDMPELRLLTAIVSGIGAGLFLGWLAYRDPF